MDWNLPVSPGRQAKRGRVCQAVGAMTAMRRRWRVGRFLVSFFQYRPVTAQTYPGGALGRTNFNPVAATVAGPPFFKRYRHRRHKRIEHDRQNGDPARNDATRFGHLQIGNSGRGKMTGPSVPKRFEKNIDPHHLSPEIGPAYSDSDQRSTVLDSDTTARSNTKSARAEPWVSCPASSRTFNHDMGR